MNLRAEEEQQERNHVLCHSSLLERSLIPIDRRILARTRYAGQQVQTYFIPYVMEITAMVGTNECAILLASDNLINDFLVMTMNTGATPRWEARLHLNLLTPGPLMQQLSNECRTIVLASGSLSPIPSLCAELNLFSEDDNCSSGLPSKTNTSIAPSKNQKRLQNHPSPLEADHVVNLQKQFFAVSIGHFPVS